MDAINRRLGKQGGQANIEANQTHYLWEKPDFLHAKKDHIHRGRVKLV
jgi:hypothetical protein